MFKEDINFSLWCDFVERSFLDGEFKELLSQNIVNGATSNPAIFKSAFLTSEAYKKERETLKGLDAKEVYETLAIKDIAIAADRMNYLYEKDDDGFISFEVDPFLCDDTQGTIEEGKRLFRTIGKDNVMIKVPATDAGYSAMEELMKEGINVNATLIFSPTQAKNTIEAFKRATETLKKNGHSKKLPQGVISIFVSRFDSKLDKKLEGIGLPVAKVGIVNATKIYNLIETYAMPNVRTLFASTGAKRDDLNPDYYIKELLFKNSINTAPLDTIKAFIKSKNQHEAIPSKECDAFFEELSKNGIDIELIYEELMHEGLLSFKDAFQQILNEL
jgi:transaldolase